jgi:hypothetical protein
VIATPTTKPHLAHRCGGQGRVRTFRAVLMLRVLMRRGKSKAHPRRQMSMFRSRQSLHDLCRQSRRAAVVSGGCSFRPSVRDAATDPDGADRGWPNGTYQ